MRVVCRARKVGGSLVVTLPIEAVKEKRIVAGELLELDVNKAKESGFGIFKGMKPFTEEDELDIHD